jgi:hypothetical protein
VGGQGRGAGTQACGVGVGRDRGCRVGGLGGRRGVGWGLPRAVCSVECRRRRPPLHGPDRWFVAVPAHLRRSGICDRDAAQYARRAARAAHHHAALQQRRAGAVRGPQDGRGRVLRRKHPDAARQASPVRGGKRDWGRRAREGKRVQGAGGALGVRAALESGSKKRRERAAAWLSAASC